MNTAFEKIWELRYDREIEKAKDLFFALIQSTPELKEDPNSVLLQASFARAQNDMPRSKKILKDLESDLTSKFVKIPYRMFFEKGLNHMFEADFSEALQEFIKARECAKTDAQFGPASLNAWICVDALGQDPQNLASDLEKKLFSKRDSVSGSVNRGLFSQFHYCQSWRFLRRGEFERLAPYFEDPEAFIEYPQFFYLLLYISELPYLDFYQKIPRALVDRFFLMHPDFLRKPYRMRTLLGVSEPSGGPDREPFASASDFADRIYLWTWRWLVSPQSQSLDQIFLELQQVSFEELGQKLRANDFYQLRNALYWLCLFDPSQKYFLEKKIRSITPKLRSDWAGFFEFEFSVIENLFVRHLEPWGAPVSEVFYQPTFKHCHLQFLITEGDERDELGEESALWPLTEGLKRLSDHARGEPDGKKLFVDLNSYEVWRDSDTVLVSESISKLLCVLSKRRVLSAQELALKVFGLSRFDTIIHLPKILNLLNRTRKILPPQVSIFYKSERIYLRDPRSQVEICTQVRHQEILSHHADWKKIFEPQDKKPEGLPIAEKKQISGLAFLKKLEANKSISRKEIETLMARPRSTTNRLIKQWVAQGYLKKIGSSKETRYLFQPTKKDKET